VLSEDIISAPSPTPIPTLRVVTVHSLKSYMLDFGQMSHCQRLIHTGTCTPAMGCSRRFHKKLTLAG